MSYTKETFKADLERITELRKKGNLSNYDECKLQVLRDVENLILFGVGVSLPTHKELLLKMDSLVEKNYSKQTEIEKANFKIGWQECFSWIALKNVYENG